MWFFSLLGDSDARCDGQQCVPAGLAQVDDPPLGRAGDPPGRARGDEAARPAIRDGRDDRRRGQARRQGKVRTRELRHRSEEHTSELQSLMRISYAVFSLKKKTKSINQEKEYSTTSLTI